MGISAQSNVCIVRKQISQEAQALLLLQSRRSQKTGSKGLKKWEFATVSQAKH